MSKQRLAHTDECFAQHQDGQLDCICGAFAEQRYWAGHAEPETPTPTELWAVVRGGEGDDWGIARQSTPFPFMDIAQMMDEDDAIEVVAAHNARVSQPSSQAGEIPIHTTSTFKAVECPKCQHRFPVEIARQSSQAQAGTAGTPTDAIEAAREKLNSGEWSLGVCLKHCFDAGRSEGAEAMRRALEEIKGYIHNRERAICQGGHPQYCDCLGRLIEQIATEALSLEMPDREPSGMQEAAQEAEKGTREMTLTKDQISDLRSLQQSVITCSIDFERAGQALKKAESQLENFLWRLEHEPQKGKLDA